MFSGVASISANTDALVLQNIFNQIESIRSQLAGLAALSTKNTTSSAVTPTVQPVQPTTVKTSNNRTVPCSDGNVIVRDVPNGVTLNNDYWCKHGGGVWRAGIDTITEAVPSKIIPMLPTNILRFGATGTDVNEVQNFLVEVGLLKPGFVSGTYDTFTANAVMAAQLKAGVRADGNWGPNTKNGITKSWGVSWGEGIVSKLGDTTTPSASGALGGGITIQPVLPQTICLSGSAPWIKVVSPNGGEVFTAGQSITVTWTDCNIPDNANVSIRLQMLSGNGTPVIFGFINQTPNDGTQTIQLPTNQNWGAMQYGNLFKVQVAGTNNIPASDLSNNLFAINTQQSASSLIVNPVFSGCTKIAAGHPRQGLCNIVMKVKNNSSSNILIPKANMDWYPNNFNSIRIENLDGSPTQNSFTPFFILSDGSSNTVDNVNLIPNETKLVSLSFVFDLPLGNPVYPINTTNVQMHFRGIPYRSGLSSSSLMIHDIPSHYSAPVSL